MVKNTVVVLTADQKKFREKLQILKLPDLEIIVPEDQDKAHAEVTRANILLANPVIAKKYINEAKNVVWMQSTFAGIDAMNTPGLRKDYLLTNVRDLYGEAMAEYVLAYILFFEKEISENKEYQKESRWEQREARLLKDKTLCILGAGSIGRVIAETVKAFHMRTLGYRTKDEPVPFFDKMYTRENLEECLAVSDYIVSVLPKTEATDNLINSETLSFMKKSAIFINIGRGNAVNETDLILALREKRIAAAVLDVFQKEPLSPENALWSLENAYLTPHVSGYVVSGKIFEIFSENYRRFLAGKALRYRIDFTKGY